MKVVQLLYSYMLTRSDFKLSPYPERQTRDNVFSYDIYLNTLILILRLSGYSFTKNHFENTKSNKLSMKVAKALSTDKDLLEYLVKENVSILDYSSVIESLYDKIIQSSVFRDFTHKRNKDIAEEVKMWVTIIDTVIAKDSAVESVARNCNNFTQTGYMLGIGMVRDTLNAYSDNRSTLANAQQALNNALDKAYELYHLLLLLPVEITRMQRSRLDEAKEKYIPTSEDLNPNTRFVDNSFINAIVCCSDMEEYLKQHPIDLDSHYLIIKKLHDNIISSDYYAQYMAAEYTDHVADCEFWRTIMKNIILPSDALAELLESSSIYWNDDLEIMGTFAIKTIKHAANSNGLLKLLPQYKDFDDSCFGASLFSDAVNNRELYRTYIDRFIDPSQWDADRLAFMDIVIMTVAISELLNFPSIPIPVTLNEYIEIANSYSTPRSGQFINGMLYSIINYLKSEGKLLKN